MAEENLTNSNEAVKLPVQHETGFVQEAEFRKFQDETKQGIDAILGLLEKREVGKVGIDPVMNAVSSVVADAQALVEAASGDRGYMPPQYQRIFEKYFDPNDGFEARLNFPEIDDKGRETGGITFTIVVPLALSNAQDAYKQFYKADLRTRALRPDGISKGIDDWCRLVSKNLKYNRFAKMK
mgnify:CR=1 FL=1